MKSDDKVSEINIAMQSKVSALVWARKRIQSGEKEEVTRDLGIKVKW